LANACDTNNRSSGPAAFTLYTGVHQVVTASDSISIGAPAVAIDTNGSGYTVHIQGVIPCQKDMQEPYLSVTREHKATLVLAASGAHSDDSACERRIEVEVTSRLRPGDVVYVLSNGEVLGHADVP
jgi:hypothetical protein